MRLLILAFWSLVFAPFTARASIRFSSDEAAKIVAEGCAKALEHLDKHHAYGPEVLAQILSGERVKGAVAAPVEAYFTGEVAKGRNPVYVGADIQLLFGFFDTPSAALLPELLERGRSLMKPILTAKGNAASHRFTPTEAGIAPKHATLKKTVEVFAELDVPLMMSDPAEFMASQTQAYGDDLHDNRFSGREDAVTFFANQALDVMSKYAVAVFEGERRGLHFASAINNVLFPESVIHEMTHAVQAHRWDYTLIMAHYQKHLKAEFDGAPRFLLPPPHIVASYIKILSRIFRNNVGGKYADAFFVKWNEAKLTDRDFVFFSSLIHLLAELDAHLQQGLMAEENGYKLARLSTQVLAHIKVGYVKPQGPIYPLTWDTVLKTGSDPLLELIKTLNTSFRPK